MEFGIQLRENYQVVSKAADWAETKGLAAFAMPDHYLQRGGNQRPSWDNLVHLAALARETSQIELVSLVSPVTFRHPAVYYKMAVTLDEVSHGRFSLGLGTGWFDEEFEVYGIPYPDMSVRYEMAEEAMKYIRAALSGHGFLGNHYHLAEFAPQPSPQNLKLIVGGSGKTKTPRLAGLYADDFNVYMCKPEDFAARVETARTWAEKAGRDPDDLSFSSAGPALAARDRSEYRRLLSRLAELTGRTPDHIEATYEKNGFPHGHGQQPSEMLAEIEEAGCQRFYMQVFAAEPEDYELIHDAYRSQ